MRTKILMLILLSHLSLYLNAEMRYRMVVKDVPEGITMADLQPRILFDYGGPTMTATMDYDESTSSFVYDYVDSYPIVLNVKFQVDGDYFLSDEWEDWKISPEQAEQTKEVSLKGYRKISLQPEDGWTFWNQETDNTVTMYQIRFSQSDSPNASWCAAHGSGTVTSDEVDYYIYAKAGDYIWSGTIFDASGRKLIVNKERVTIDDHSEQLTLRVDWSTKSLVTCSVTGIPEEKQDYVIFLDQVNQDFFFTKQTELLLERGKTYHWSLRNTEVGSFFAYPKSGGFTTEQSKMDLVIDYSDCRKSTLTLTEKEGFRMGIVNLSLQDNEGMNNNLSYVPPYLPMYLPDGHDVDLNFSCTLWDEQSREWAVFPYRTILTAGQQQNLVIDLSAYHKIDFTCQGQAVDPWVAIQGEEDPYFGELARQSMYMPDGKYHASFVHPDGAALECDFTVEGTDQVVEFEYTPDDYKRVTVELQNADRVPSSLEIWNASLDILQDGELLATHLIYLNEGTASFVLKKGTYDYELSLDENGPYAITMPQTGSFEVIDTTQQLNLDLCEFCFVPLNVKNEEGEQLPAFYYIINGDQKTLSYLEMPMYMILPEGTYPLELFLGGYEPLKKEIQLNCQIDEIPLVMKKGDIFPLFVAVENLKEGEMATVAVDGIGSYICYEDGFPDGDFLPFMSVKAGVYSLTITAPGYETYRGQIAVDREHYSPDDLGVYYEFTLQREGTGLENQEQTVRPKVSLVGDAIQVVSETECKIGVYTVSGVCVARLEGNNVRTESLPSGLYVVRMLTADKQSFITKINVHR